MQCSQLAIRTACSLLLATTLSTATLAETITLTVSAESFVADSGASYDPIGGPLRLILEDKSPEEQQEFLNALGYDDFPPFVSTPSGIVGLSGSIDIELTPPGAGSNPSIAFLGSTILADGVLQNQGSLGFLGSLLSRIDDAVLGIGTSGGPPPPGIEINNDGTFALTPHQFSLIGGISTIEGVGPLAGVVNDDPLNVPLDLSTSPIDLVYGRPDSSDAQVLEPLELNAILSGSSNLNGTNEVELYIPFTLAYSLHQVGGEIGNGFLNANDRWVSLDGVIVATGTSSFPIPQSSLLVVPEPSTLLMAMIGVPLFAVAFFRSYRRTPR